VKHVQQPIEIVIGVLDRQTMDFMILIPHMDSMWFVLLRMFVQIVILTIRRVKQNHIFAKDVIMTELVIFQKTLSNSKLPSLKKKQAS
jgi:hypothetical protein